jgi:2,3-bisphosphoglycerate-independent phosphoglycerate mutase
MEGKKAILLILDGWGIGQIPSADAIRAADTPVMDQLWSDYPHTTLVTFGEEVGLPEGQMGNSEVGHMNIGAGRIVYQELARINKAFREHAIDENAEIKALINYCNTKHKPLHLLCLLSDGGVHSHITHLRDTIMIANKAGINEIYVHAFLDGRDTSPTGGLGYIRQLQEYMQGTTAQLATVIGRYYSMDRDKRWERVRKAYDLLVKGLGERNTGILDFIQQNYEVGITDEFMTPWINAGIRQGSDPVIREGDAAFFVNFRTDRPRQLTEVLTQQAITEYDMKPMDLYFVTMTEYDSSFKNIHIIFHKDELKNTLGEYLSDQHKTQWRIAETEKYPHVTYFFSGGIETPFSGEKRYMAPSPKVATYDLAPEMSAVEVKDAVLDSMRTEAPDFICVNFANTDMVGHTGVFHAAMVAAETVDACVGEIIETVLSQDYRAIIIADHGNSDYMINEDGSPNTAHTKNPVPCILVGNDIRGMKIQPGKLGDIAPTLLTMLGMKIPAEMTGKSLIVQ